MQQIESVVDEFNAEVQKNLKDTNISQSKKYNPVKGSIKQKPSHMEGESYPREDKTAKNKSSYKKDRGSIKYETTHVEGESYVKDKDGKKSAYGSAKQAKKAPKDITKTKGADKITNDKTNKIYSQEIKTNLSSQNRNEVSFKKKDLIKGIIYSEILSPKFKDN